MREFISIILVLAFTETTKPWFLGANSICGATGRDNEGRGYIVGRRDGNTPIIFRLEF